MAGAGWTHGRAEVAGALLSRRCRAPPFFGGRGNPRCTVSLDPSPVRERDQGGAQALVPDRAAEGSDVPPASGLALHSLRKNDRCQPRALVIGEGLSREPPHESLGDIARAAIENCLPPSPGSEPLGVSGPLRPSTVSRTGWTQVGGVGQFIVVGSG